MLCWCCHKDIGEVAVYRDTACPYCKADLHSCRACSFYSLSSPYGCREHIQEPISDKERANFCDSYRAATSLKGATAAQAVKAQAAKVAFSALFKD